jgi:hypothetical protein
MNRGVATLPSKSASRLANALGWFSLGLGAAELLAPQAMAHWLGMRHGAPILKAYGAREVAAGAAMLASRNKAPFVWSRVAGDVLDIATLVSVAIERPSKRQRVALALAAVAGVTVADIACALAVRRSIRNVTHVRDQYGAT